MTLSRRDSPGLALAPSIRPASNTRLIVADDHQMFLDGLALALAEHGFDVVARCRDGVEVLQAVQDHAADVLLLDIRMPRKDGLEVLRELREGRRALPVVVLTAALSDQDIVDVLRLGARGLILKDAVVPALVQCVREVHRGGRWLDPTCTVRVADTMIRREAGMAEVGKVLTPREYEIMRKVVAGLRNKAIARELSVSEGTIKIHLHHIYEKLELDGRFALMHWAQERSLI